MTADISKKPAARAKPGRTVAAAEASTSPQVSSALRTAYEQAVREDVPAEFMDLLRKLS